MPVSSEIITIGDELLIGQTLDTNSAWLGENLGLIGIRVHHKSVVGDHRDDIAVALEEAFRRSDLIIITGGLGPTRDDITKEVLCHFLGVKLVRDPALEKELTEFFKSRALPMLESNKKQAELPEGAIAIRNKRGTAPGIWFEKEGKVLIALPGVPHEMTGMMEDELLGMIARFFDTPGIIHKTILTYGIGESFLAEKIRTWEDRLLADNLFLAYLPSPGMVRLRISSYDGQKEEMEKKIERYIAELKEILGDDIVGYDNDSLPALVGKDLLTSRSTVSVAESCTGGYLAHLMTSIPGSGDWFNGGVVAYQDTIKSHVLDVSEKDLNKYTAVSEPVALQMAAGVSRKLGTTYGISTTGIAGPAGGTAENPVGSVWIGVSGPGWQIAKHFQFGKNRERNIVMAANTALHLFRKEIMRRGIDQ